MFKDVLTTLVSTLALLGLTIIFMYFYLKYKKPNSVDVTLSKVTKSFINRFMGEKLEKELFKESSNADDSQSNKLKSDNELTKNVFKSVPNNTSTLTYSSKNYDEDDTYQVKTWFGLNPKRLINSTQYKYVCFNVKDVQELYFNAETIRTFLKENHMADKTKLDIYINQGKDGEWYLTRFGTYFDTPQKLNFKYL